MLKAPYYLYLYNCQGVINRRIKEIADYLRSILPQTRIEERDDFFFCLKEREGIDFDYIAKEIARCRVYNPAEEAGYSPPLPLEIAYERKRIAGNPALKGMIYDGFRLQFLIKQFLERGESNLSSCHIIFTNQLIATFPQPERRYHLRVGIFGFPNIISLGGIGEALAKPREYYLRLQGGEEAWKLKDEFRNDIIDDNDERLSQLLKGYCLQALLYHLRGEAFCNDKGCRFYNAHWQKEAIRAQIGSNYEFCSRHSRVISQWREGVFDC